MRKTPYAMLLASVVPSWLVPSPCVGAPGDQDTNAQPTTDAQATSDAAPNDPSEASGGSSAQPGADAAAESKGKESLIDASPEILFQEMRYPKFYGGPNFDAATIDGGLLDRQYLLGSLWGSRDKAAEHGIFVDFGLTQVLQGVVAGNSSNDVSYVGSADLWLSLDTGLAGLWPGGLIYSHAEGDWGNPLSRTGALLPLNTDATMPGTPASIALSEIYLTQALSEEIIIVAGKADWAAFVDTSFFANNERTQFLNNALVNNAVLGVLVPYTAWGAFLMAQPTKDLAIGAAVLQNAGSATVTGFSDLSVNELTFGAAIIYNPVFDTLPGSYQLLLAYTSKDSPSFAIDRRYLIGEIIGVLPPITEEGNYALSFTATQYVWVDPAAASDDKDEPPVGWGPFFRFGIVPADRNVIDQFYSVGIGGRGVLVPGRNDDLWGIGWAGSHISDDLRSLVGAFNDFEYVVEAFYNVALTPAASLTFDVQYVYPTGSIRSNLVVLGTRLQLDF